MSDCTINKACCQVRTSLASRTRRMRSVLVNVGRFTCRLRTISCWRKRAFSAMSSDLLLPRSVRVESGKEEMCGVVQRVKREESASQQPSFSRWREVKTPARQEASPSYENSVVQACVYCRRHLILHRPACVCKQGMKIFLRLDALVLERMIQVASTQKEFPSW